MDGRTRIAFSGIAAFAVTATVAASVAATNAVAFADTPGTAIDAARVDVQPVPRATPLEVVIPGDVIAEPESVPEPTPAPITPSAPIAETVPAPAPVVVAPAPPPAAAPLTPAPVPSVSDEEALRAAIESGDRDAVYAWAEAHGWSREDVDRFLDSRDHDDAWRGGRDKGRDRDKFVAPNPPVQSGSPAVTESPQRGDGSKRDRSHGSPDHRD